ncbi:MAG: hypothetical protein GXP50_03645 [Deltaproteobacteria bacterium]|nr:hypothetical protein [Deltaproteobacteria bacterium]
MLIRLLFYGVLIWLVVRLVKGLKPKPRVQPRPRPAPGRAIQGGELVQDPHCGVYVPKESAVPGPGGAYFCSEACRDAHAKGGDPA